MDITGKYLTVANTITKWKSDSIIEKCLSRMADNSEICKCIYIYSYKFSNPQYYKKGKDLATKIIHDFKTRIPELTLLSDKWVLRDMIYSLHRFGVDFNEYFLYRLFEKNAVGKSKFNNLKRHYGYCQILNGSNVRDLCEDKHNTYKLLQEYYKRDLCYIDSIENKSSFIDFLEKHSKFIFKPIRGHSGQGIGIFSSSDIHPTQFLNEMLEKYGPFIIEELIVQGKSLSAIHPESINTVRLVTFKTNNEIDVYGAALRMGKDYSSVDNAGSGGIFASINIDYGFVTSLAIDYKLNEYPRHPNTNIPIPGFGLPDWDEAIQMVKEMAMKIPNATILAWDLAYSTTGWCLVEINDVGDPHLLQAPYNKGMRIEIDNKIDNWIKNQTKKNDTIQ